jgi:hypothetical protein
MREWETASPPFSRRRGSGDSSRYVLEFGGPDWIPRSRLRPKAKKISEPKSLFWRLNRFLLKTVEFFLHLKFFSAFDNKKTCFWIRILILALDPVRIWMHKSMDLKSVK